MDALSVPANRLSRRGAARGIAAAGALLATVGLGRRASAQDAEATTRHPVVGAWRVVPDPPGPPLLYIVYHADGTLVFSAPVSAPAAPGSAQPVVFSTPAYGAWQPTGERSAALSASLIESDGAGAFLDTLWFHGTVEVDETGDAYRFAGVVQLADPSGAVTTLGPATTRGTRIAVDLAAATAATPVATPAG
jgi:hypothetical protein